MISFLCGFNRQNSLRYTAVFMLFSLWLAGPLQAETSPASNSQNRRQPETVYQDTTLTEDVNWRGTILIKGSLVIAPQATLRIEPGTVIRFVATGGSNQLPGLVVLGRIHAAGTSDRPVLFAPRQAKSSRGSWGGIHLLTSEKRNQLEHCRIEGAETGIDSRFSTLSIKSVTIANTTTGIILRDSTASMTALSVTGCETGLGAYDSEVELRDSSVSENRAGLMLMRSSIVLSSVSIKGNIQQGIQSDDCRLRISSCEVEGNAVGAHVKGGEGQVTMSRFMRNRDTGLQLSSSRLKVNRCRIAENARDGLLMDDGRAVVWENDISGNGGFNLVYTGRENVTAIRNWWGTTVETALLAKINSTAGGQRPVSVNVYPWLTAKPSPLP